MKIQYYSKSDKYQWKNLCYKTYLRKQCNLLVNYVLSLLFPSEIKKNKHFLEEKNTLNSFSTSTFSA